MSDIRAIVKQSTYPTDRLNKLRMLMAMDRTLSYEEEHVLENTTCRCGITTGALNSVLKN